MSRLVICPIKVAVHELGKDDKREGREMHPMPNVYTCAWMTGAKKAKGLQLYDVDLLDQLPVPVRHNLKLSCDPEGGKLGVQCGISL